MFYRLKIPAVVFLSITSLAASIIAAENPFKVEKNTVALWVFDQGEGGKTEDLAQSGISFEAKLNHTEEWQEVPATMAEGKFGKALFFSGTSALVGSPGGTIETPEKVTLEVWLKIDPQSEGVTRGIFEYMAHDRAGYRMMVLANGYLNWNLHNGTQEVPLRSMTKVPVDEWVHLAGTYDGATMKIFINGELDAEIVVDDGVPQGVGKPFVGFISAGGGPYFRGIIEAVRISNEALTEFVKP